eukprot:31542-Pelagococcus_subviridis.AAC.14
MPSVSRPCEPASLRKHVEYPANRIGSSLGWIHRFLRYEQHVCSDVAMRYLSSLSSPDETLYSCSSKSASCAHSAMRSLRMKNGVASGVCPLPAKNVSA